MPWPRVVGRRRGRSEIGGGRALDRHWQSVRLKGLDDLLGGGRRLGQADAQSVDAGCGQDPR
ncbi:MAG TPA: hypothetical protein VGX78_12105, partial [Pirellulales bacterium]|nr:hypothetical protein [Pirellulales bacterium]